MSFTHSMHLFVITIVSLTVRLQEVWPDGQFSGQTAGQIGGPAGAGERAGSSAGERADERTG